MELRYRAGEAMVAVQVEAASAGYTVTVDGRPYQVSAEAAPGRPGELVLIVDGRRCRAWVAPDGARRWVAVDGECIVLEVPPTGGRGGRGHSSSHDTLEAQMPGLVRRVLVAQGDTVERGQALLLLEAMKMEIHVSAPHPGRVRAVCVSEGQAVERGQLLIEIEA